MIKRYVDDPILGLIEHERGSIIRYSDYEAEKLQEKTDILSWINKNLDNASNFALGNKQELVVSVEDLIQFLFPGKIKEEEFDFHHDPENQIGGGNL